MFYWIIASQSILYVDGRNNGSVNAVASIAIVIVRQLNDLGRGNRRSLLGFLSVGFGGRSEGGN